jgi:hypothetical protein
VEGIDLLGDYFVVVHTLGYQHSTMRKSKAPSRVFQQHVQKKIKIEKDDVEGASSEEKENLQNSPETVCTKKVIKKEGVWSSSITF